MLGSEEHNNLEDADWNQRYGRNPTNPIITAKEWPSNREIGAAVSMKCDCIDILFLLSRG